MTPGTVIRAYITAHEGGLSLDRADSGNFHRGVLVGSKFGVTGDVLAAYRGVPAVSAKDMAALTIDEAVRIGLKMFYLDPGFGQLVWNRVTATVLDMGWGAGLKPAVRLLQRLIGAKDDGVIGPDTARRYKAWLAQAGEEAAAAAYAVARNAFYERCIAAAPEKAKFRNGWRNRTASFLPGTTWWRQFGSPAE